MRTEQSQINLIRRRLDSSSTTVIMCGDRATLHTLTLCLVMKSKLHITATNARHHNRQCAPPIHHLVTLHKTLPHISGACRLLKMDGDHTAL
jgi:hypothetical protein